MCSKKCILMFLAIGIVLGIIIAIISAATGGDDEWASCLRYLFTLILIQKIN